MNRVQVICILLATLLPAIAQDETNAPAAFIASVQDWTQENVDDWVFDLAGLDRSAVSQFLKDAQSEVQQASAASQRQADTNALKFLEVLHEYEETEPVADWITSFLHANSTSQTTSSDPASVSAKSDQPPTDDRSAVVDRRQRWIQILSHRPESEAASEYVAKLKPIFVEEGVPAELVWLAQVESSFDPDARSPVGAVGLFQLMPDTARSLGLSLWPFDQRKQPLKNARAAAQYLRHLYERFGDWELALAAYNAGETRVAGLLKKNGTHSYASIDDQLPAETRNYVPKVEAIIWVREGVHLSQLVAAQE